MVSKDQLLDCFPSKVLDCVVRFVETVVLDSSLDGSSSGTSGSRVSDTRGPRAKSSNLCVAAATLEVQDRSSRL